MMNRLLLCTLCVVVSSDVCADSFRCGRSIVKLGESSNALMKKCGDPLRKYSSKEAVYKHGRQSNVTVSNWVYTRRGKNDMIVSVRSGAVIKIQVD